MRTRRTLAAALAIGALAVPAAQAQPADNGPLAQASVKAQNKEDPIADIHAPLARAAAANARAQDLRRLRAGNVGRAANANSGANTPGATYTSGATAGGQYTPGATAANSQPLSISPARAVAPGSGNGAPATPIGLGIAGSLLGIAGIVALARRSRRNERTRVTA